MPSIFTVEEKIPQQVACLRKCIDLIDLRLRYCYAYLAELNKSGKEQIQFYQYNEYLFPAIQATTEDREGALSNIETTLEELKALSKYDIRALIDLRVKLTAILDGQNDALSTVFQLNMALVQEGHALSATPEDNEILLAEGTLPVN